MGTHGSPGESADGARLWLVSIRRMGAHRPPDNVAGAAQLTRVPDTSYVTAHKGLPEYEMSTRVEPVNVIGSCPIVNVPVVVLVQV